MSSQTELLEGHWDILKGKIKSHWGKLTNNDLDQIDGSFDELSGRLKKLYGYTENQIRSEFNSLMSEIDIDSFTNRARENYQKIKNTFAEGMEGFEDSLSTFKENTIQAEEALVKYIKANPVKTAGIALVVGALAAFLIAKR